MWSAWRGVTESLARGGVVAVGEGEWGRRGLVWPCVLLVVAWWPCVRVGVVALIWFRRSVRSSWRCGRVFVSLWPTSIASADDDFLPRFALTGAILFAGCCMDCPLFPSDVADV